MLVTPHWTDMVLAAAIDPSGGGDIGASARAHATECPVCAEALADMQNTERAIGRALRTLDHPVPAIDMAQIVARASGPVPVARLRRRGRNTARYYVRSLPALIAHRSKWGAGAIILGIGAVAAAAVPGSPIRHLIARIFVPQVEMHAPAVSAHTVPHPSLAISATPQTPRGVAMIPHGPIAILFVSAQATGVIRILPGGGSAVAVRGDGDGATYTIGQDTIVVENSGKSALNYDVELPSMAQCPRLYIRVGDQLLYSRSEGRIHTRAILDTAGRYIIPMRL